MRICIIGYSGHSLGIIDSIKKNGSIVVGYFDITPKKNFEGLRFLGQETDMTKGHNIFITIGDNLLRKRVYEKTKSLNNLNFNIIDISSNVSQSSSIGYQTYVGKNALINERARIGIGCIINSGAVLEHECKIGNFTHIAPATTVCGNVTIGKNCLIGANSTILPNIRIGDNVIVGAGSVVLKDIESNSKFAGNPARKI